MQDAPRYDDVVAEVASFLEERLGAAVAAGIREERICLDPGFGFGKTPDQNLELLRGLERIVALGRPVLVGLSRKSTLARVTGDERGRIGQRRRLGRAPPWRRSTAGPRCSACTTSACTSTRSRPRPPSSGGASTRDDRALRDRAPRLPRRPRARAPGGSAVPRRPRARPRGHERRRETDLIEDAVDYRDVVATVVRGLRRACLPPARGARERARGRPPGGASPSRACGCASASRTSSSRGRSTTRPSSSSGAALGRRRARQASASV